MHMIGHYHEGQGLRLTPLPQVVKTADYESAQVPIPKNRNTVMSRRRNVIRAARLTEAPLTQQMSGRPIHLVALTP